MQTKQDNCVSELALEKAAKIICNLKCGLCPMREENCSGCSCTCDEEIRPWKCWVIHLRELSTRACGAKNT